MSMRVLISALMAWLLNPALAAGPIRVYVNENGVKVFTNVGMRNPVAEEEEAIPPAGSDRSPYLALISRFASQHSLDEKLVEAIVQVESNFDPLAISPKGCKGLMQLHPETARRFGVRNIFDPVQNIEGGIKYLRFLMNYFNRDLTRVLAAYNAGENTVDRYRGVPPYRETQDYVRKVTAVYEPAVTAAEDTTWRQRRVHRVVQPDGRILFTNAAAESSLN